MTWITNMHKCVNISLKTVLLRSICLLFLGLECLHPAFSQDNLQHLKESLYLQTDRNLYIVGEQVWIKVNKLDAQGKKPDNFSKVVYIELLSKSGQPVNQLKLHVPDKSGSAGFTLSDTLSSGNYLLRAYTNWMKNFPATDFSFKTISVINPFKSMEEIGVKRSIPVLEAKNTSPEIRTDKGLVLEAKFDTTTFGTRERVKVNIQARDSKGNPVEADLSVSIVRSCLFQDIRGNIHDAVHLSGGVEPGVQASYLPELEGVILSDYFVELEPDFYSAYDHPLPGPLTLDTTILRALNQVIINMQIENIYQPYQFHKHSPNPDTPEIDFYSEPEYHILISDYIPLKTIREVIKEIVPAVSVRVKEGRSYLWVDNGVDDLHFNNKPLVLVDGVLFDDVDQILNIRLTELEYIEVINLRYFLDGLMFEGIIHFVTKEGSMAGLEFHHAVFRQAYAALSEEFFFRSPGYSDDSDKSSPIPDFRNTLYWNPGLQTREDGHTGFEFYTADDRGEYIVFIEGISPEGKSGSLYKKLIVQ